VAEAELERDVRRSLRGFYQRFPKEAVTATKSRPPGVWGGAGGGVLDKLPDAPHGDFLT